MPAADLPPHIDGCTCQPCLTWLSDWLLDKETP